MFCRSAKMRTNKKMRKVNLGYGFMNPRVVKEYLKDEEKTQMNINQEAREGEVVKDWDSKINRNRM